MRNFKKQERFPILRFFGIASLISISLTALFLFGLFRQITISALAELGEQSNVNLAYATLNPVRPLLIDYLHDVNIVDGKHPRNAAIEEIIRLLMQDTAVSRVEFYDDHGHVAYSTEQGAIGDFEADNPGFVAAMKGEVFSELLYRDSFNLFAGEDEDANLIQTYLPIRESPIHPVIGVFEIYRDVSSIVARTERAEILIIVGVSAILAVLFGFLFLVVRYSNRIIVEQQSTIRERTRTLEFLSAQMLNAQEVEKKDMAVDLHEGIAQTLGGVKAHLEALVPRADKDCSEGVQRLVPMVQAAIQEVRGLAMQLRPSSLDDLGLLATLSWLTRSLEDVYDIAVSSSIEVDEAEIPRSLKVIVYRVTQEALGIIGKAQQASRVALTLKRENGELVLTLADDGVAYVANAGEDQRSPDRDLQLVKERTILSGGRFDVERSAASRSIVAAWPLLLSDYSD